MAAESRHCSGHCRGYASTVPGRCFRMARRLRPTRPRKWLAGWGCCHRHRSLRTVSRSPISLRVAGIHIRSWPASGRGRTRPRLIPQWPSPGLRIRRRAPSMNCLPVGASVCGWQWFSRTPSSCWTSRRPSSIAHQIELSELCRDLNENDGHTLVAVPARSHHACRYGTASSPWKDGAVVARGPASRDHHRRTGSQGIRRGVPHHRRPGFPADGSCSRRVANGASNLLAVIQGRLDPATLGPVSDWRPLFDSYAEMADTQAG